MRNPDHWNRRSVLELLCSTLSFLSEDDYEFEFEKVTNPVPIQDYLEFSDTDGGATFKADEVVLFSGGLDSLSGAIEELSTNGKRVALVSHRSSPKMYDQQKHLVTELVTRFPQKVMHIPVLRNPTNAPGPRIYAAISVLSLRGTRLRCRPSARKQPHQILRERCCQHQFANLRAGRRCPCNAHHASFGLGPFSAVFQCGCGQGG